MNWGNTLTFGLYTKVHTHALKPEHTYADTNMNMYIYHICNTKCQAGLLVWCLLVILIMGKWEGRSLRQIAALAAQLTWWVLDQWGPVLKNKVDSTGGMTFKVDLWPLRVSIHIACCALVYSHIAHTYIRISFMNRKMSHPSGLLKQHISHVHMFLHAWTSYEETTCTPVSGSWLPLAARHMIWLLCTKGLFFIICK